MRGLTGKVGFMLHILRRWGWWVHSTLFLRLVWKRLWCTSHRLYLRAPETVWEVISVKGSALAPSLSICRTSTIRERFPQCRGPRSTSITHVCCGVCGFGCRGRQPAAKSQTHHLPDGQSCSLSASIFLIHRMGKPSS